MIFDSFKNQDIEWKSGKTFGAVYYPGDEYAQVISKAYSRFLNKMLLILNCLKAY